MQGVRREAESEGQATNVQGETHVNERWPSTSTTRHKYGEVSYTTFGPCVLRGSVLKEHGGVGGDYRQHEREVECVTMGDLIESCVREGGAKAGEEARVNGCYKSKGEVRRDAR